MPTSPSRRPAATRAAVALTGLVALAGCSSGSSSGSAPVPASSAPAPASSAPATSAVAGGGAAAGGASLEVTMQHLRIASALGQGVTVDVKGRVPQLRSGDGQVLSAADTEVMGTHLTWGDGAQDGSDPGDVTCTTSGTLVDLSEQFTYSHTYAKAGTYTITFTAGACAPLKDVTKSVVVTVG